MSHILLLCPSQALIFAYSVSIPDLDHLYTIIALLNVDVDWKVSIDVSHLVLVASRYTSDQVVNDRFDCA